MTIINSALRGITVGETQAFGNLSIIPLLAAAAGSANYLTLEEAQAQGLTKITETSESGSVPTLLLVNEAEQAVFLLDGEELVGAKQNRIINLSLLVPANTTLEVPVSCVEQGRWRHRTREFASAERTFFSKGRARKAARVSESLRAGVGGRSNQGEVWSDIGEKMASMSVNSDTDAIADAYEHFSVSLDEYVRAFKPDSSQVGACFSINGQIRGLELFDACGTCAKLIPKLIRSYALDAIEERLETGSSAQEDDVKAFIDTVANAPVDVFKALGEGEDLRIHSEAVAGGALTTRDQLIHLCAFRLVA